MVCATGKKYEDRSPKVPLSYVSESLEKGPSWQSGAKRLTNGSSGLPGDPSDPGEFNNPGVGGFVWLPVVLRPPTLAFWHYGLMAMRKMTFSVPEPLAVELLRRVASRDRSRFVSEALAARLEERDVALIRACEIANQDLDVADIEKEFDAIGDEMAEPWK